MWEISVLLNYESKENEPPANASPQPWLSMILAGFFQRYSLIPSTFHSKYVFVHVNNDLFSMFFLPVATVVRSGTFVTMTIRGRSLFHFGESRMTVKAAFKLLALTRTQIRTFSGYSSSSLIHTWAWYWVRAKILVSYATKEINHTARLCSTVITIGKLTSSYPKTISANGRTLKRRTPIGSSQIYRADNVIAKTLPVL